MPVTLVFDVLRRDGEDLTSWPYCDRRRELEALALDGPSWTTAETFDDGRASSRRCAGLGYEGVVAKNHASLYRPGERGWVKVKTPNYWRRDAEIEAISRKHERRVRAHAYAGR